MYLTLSLGLLDLHPPTVRLSFCACPAVTAASGGGLRGPGGGSRLGIFCVLSTQLQRLSFLQMPVPFCGAAQHGLLLLSDRDVGGCPCSLGRLMPPLRGYFCHLLLLPKESVDKVYS